MSEHQCPAMMPEHESGWNLGQCVKYRDHSDLHRAEGRATGERFAFEWVDPVYGPPRPEQGVINPRPVADPPPEPKGIYD